MYGAILEIFSVHVQRPRTTKSHTNRVNAAELWRHIDFSRWRPRHGNSTSDFVLVILLNRKVKIYLPTKFWRYISVHGWDITTSGFWKQTYKLVPCLNSTSGDDFHICFIIGMPFCISLPNFVQIGLSAT